MMDDVKKFLFVNFIKMDKSQLGRASHHRC